MPVLEFGEEFACDVLRVAKAIEEQALVARSHYSPVVLSVRQDHQSPAPLFRDQQAFGWDPHHPPTLG